MQTTDIDDTDRDFARGSYERVTTKSLINLELIVENLGRLSLEDDTSIPDKINIANLMAKVSSAPEQSKRVGDTADSGPRGPTLIINIPGRERVIEGTALDMKEDRAEPALAGLDEIDGAWGLL